MSTPSEYIDRARRLLASRSTTRTARAIAAYDRIRQPVTPADLDHIDNGHPHRDFGRAAR